MKKIASVLSFVGLAMGLLVGLVTVAALWPLAYMWMFWEALIEPTESREGTMKVLGILGLVSMPAWTWGMILFWEILEATL